MNNLTLLNLHGLHFDTHSAADACPIVRQNLIAAGTSADDVARALDERFGHIEFSLFTPPEGRA